MRLMLCEGNQAMFLMEGKATLTALRKSGFRLSLSATRMGRVTRDNFLALAESLASWGPWTKGIVKVTKGL